MKTINYFITQESFFYLKLFLIIFTIVLILFIVSKISTFIKNKLEIRKFYKEQDKVIKDKEKLREMNKRARIRQRKNYW